MRWQDIPPEQAAAISLPHNGMEGPMNELGERCPWPWDPQQLKGAPLGQYHCPYCGGMQFAGIEHLDWTEEQIKEMEEHDASQGPDGSEPPF